MSEAEPLKKRRRRRRRRKAPVAQVPLAQSQAAPPDPGPIEQPATDAAGNQVYVDDDDAGPVRPDMRRAAVVSVPLPLRSHEVLAWAAAAKGMTLEQFTAQCLAGAAASMRPAFRQAKTGRLSGSMKAADIGKFTE